MARRELNQHREELTPLANNMAKTYSLSEAAGTHCAQDMLRYRETHGQNPSSNQTDKMAQISRQVEHKEYGYLSSRHDADKIAFLRRKEGDLLLRHGLDHDAPSQLDQTQIQAKKSLELLQRQVEREQVHSKQMELGL